VSVDPTLAPPAAQPDWKDVEIKKAREEAAKYRTELRAKEEADKKAQEEALAKQGEFKTLYEQEQAKAAQLAKDNEELRQFKQAASDKEEAVRKIELTKLPETVRAAFENASLEQIQAALLLQNSAQATQQAAQTPSPTANSPVPATNGVPDPNKRKTLAEMIQEQLNKK
jgi:hypothetical protein